MPQLRIKLEFLCMIPLLAALNTIVSQTNLQPDSKDAEIAYFIFLGDRRQESQSLPSGQRCRNCSSERFMLQETLQDNITYDRPVVCEKYVCDNCGRETEFWKYFDLDESP